MGWPHPKRIWRCRQIRQRSTDHGFAWLVDQLSGKLWWTSHFSPHLNQDKMASFFQIWADHLKYHSKQLFRWRSKPPWNPGTVFRWRSVTRWFAAAAAPNSALGVTPSWRRATHVAWLRRGPLTTIWNACLLGNLEGFNGFCKWTIIVGHKGLLTLACSLLNLASPRWLHAKRAQLCGPTHRGTGETPAEERESESQSESQIQI